MQVFPYLETDAAGWDELAARAPTATFLHTRRYLSYHGERFRDASLLVRDEGRLVGLLPAAVDPSDEGRVVSHPGITYGGLLHDGELGGERMLSALRAALGFYAEAGFRSLRYKAVPHIYHRSPASDDLYALFRCGATRYRCDLSSAIDLSQRGRVSSRRKRGFKKAVKGGVEVAGGAEFFPDFWEILAGNLARKYNQRPTHTLEEIRLLHSLFPQEIELVVARLDSRVVAGTTLFLTPRVAHAQYIASDPAGHETCALDAVFEYCIERAAARGNHFFDFGNSNEREGRYLNAGLHQFKSEFGAGGVVHEFYEIDLGAGVADEP